MSGTDILGISTSALLAYQQALQTTGNNVANANTPGYSRERVNLTSNPSQPMSNYYLGSGVNVSGVQRITSQFANKQVSDATSANARYQTYSQYAQQVDNLLGQQSTGLQSAVQSFFNSVQTVTNSPSSIAARQQLIAQGGSLVGRFNTLYQQINGISEQLNSKISNEASTINSLASQVAKLNKQIVTDGNTNVSGKPNSLLDKRSHLINELSKHVSVNTVTQSNGAVNVMIGTGQALVVGTSVTKLATAPLTGDPSQLGLVFKTQAGNEPVSNVVTGGNLGGLLETRKQIISPALNGLGRLAIGISTAFNAQQHKGIDLTGNFGSNFFKSPNASIYNSPNNPSGDSTPSISINQISKLTTDNYRLSYNGTNWSMTNTNTNQSVPLQAVSGTTNTYTAAGLTITVPTTNITAGDSFTIKPTRYAARDIAMAMTDPRQIAAAVPITSAANQTNTGTGTIGKMQVINAANSNLRDNVVITMTSATTFKVVDQTKGGTTLASNQPYNPNGTTIHFNGWQTTLSGAAATGDTFTVSPVGPGNNGNALKLAALQQKNLLEYGAIATGKGTTTNGPGATLGQAYNQLVADIGTKTQSAQNNASNQKSLLNQAHSLQQSISGVNLDQQASNLLKYQQDYQASAKVIATAKTLFQTLLNAVG